MKKLLGISEIKRIGLEGLLQLDSVCKERKLIYYLGYGSLIGAVRHNGFIPWDDDIDVWMPRKDYETLEKLTVQKKIFKNWELLSCKYNTRYKFPWMKLTNVNTEILPSRFNNGFIYGVSIDIFPLDTLPGVTEEECLKSQQTIRRGYTDLLKKTRVIIDNSHPKIIQMLENIYCTTVGKRWNFAKEIVKLELKNTLNTQGRFCTCFYDPYGVVWETKVFKHIERKQFEGYEFNIPSDYDSVLKTIYGNYMKLPPKEKQIISHTYKAYLKE